MKANLLLCYLAAFALNTDHAVADPDKTKPYPKFFPIELICPATESDGTLNLVSQNVIGDRNQMRVLYFDYNPKTVEVAVAGAGDVLKTILRIDLVSDNHPIDQEYANELAAKANAIKTNVCEGTASNRRRYLAALAKNKSIFISASRNRGSN